MTGVASTMIKTTNMQLNLNQNIINTHMNSKIIVALDFSSRAEVMSLVRQLEPKCCRLKVGKELFTACGTAIIHELQELGFEIFLDLKFYDIPNTVYKAIRAAADLRVWMVNVHASGGREMLLKANAAINDSQHKPLLIAVTILTSMGQNDFVEIGYKLPLKKHVIHLAKLSCECGLDGVVCSAHEALAIKKATNDSFLTITPGIRLKDSELDDQTRIMTPDNAIRNSVDYLVIGRPITAATSPLDVLNKINNEINLIKG